MSENAETISTSNTTISTVSIARSKDPVLLARMVIRDGKPFQTSAVQAGYSPSTGRKGLKWLLAESQEFAAAYHRESSANHLQIGSLKPLAIKRLYEEIINPKSSQGIKAIELAGRFKETDWFVRNVDVQIGVFAALGDKSPAEDTLDTYKDE